MEAILLYSVWLIVTTLWTLISKESKKQAVLRYCSSFILVSLIYYFACLGTQPILPIFTEGHQCPSVDVIGIN